MKKYRKNIMVALMSFFIIIILNFFLPRLLPGDPVAYLTGMPEEDMTAAQYSYYKEALHLNESGPVQFGYYLKSILDGTLGYSYKKEAVVSALILERLGFTLQITIPGVVFSTLIGLFGGLYCGSKKGSAADRFFSSVLIIVNTIPTFLLALVFIMVFCFQNRWLPYSGLNFSGVPAGTWSYAADRVKHLFLPVLTLTITTLPSRFLLMRNTAARIAEEKYILYAKERGLSDHKIRFSYMLKNIAQPFLTMVGMSVSLCVGGSLVIENIFSINGMGGLLNEAVYTLDYPLMQGILFVTTLIMVLSIIATDIICILIDPKVRYGVKDEK